MEKENIIKIDLYAGCTIDKAYELLKKAETESGKKAMAKFNGHEIYSYETLDEMYLKIMEMTESEAKEKHRQYMKELEEGNSMHISHIPELTVKYRERARGIIPEHLLSDWDDCVPIRLNDIYKGLELECCLNILSALSDEKITKQQRFKQCRELFYEQGHSGCSAEVLFSLLKYFHPLGAELVCFIKEL